MKKCYQLEKKVLKPFWNTQCLEISKLLWYPENTDLQDLQDLQDLEHISSSKLSSVSSNQMMENSSFWITKMKNQKMKNWQTTYSLSSTSLTVDKWEKEDIELKSKMIRIYPTKKQTKILDDWRHTNRYVYNKTIAYTRNNPSEKINFQSFRNSLVTNTIKDVDDKRSQNPNVKLWEMKTPKEIRAYAVKDVVTAYKTAWSNLKNRNISHFKIGFRKKKSPTSSMTIQKQSIDFKNNYFYIYNTFFSGSGISIGKRTLKKIKNDFKDGFKVEHDSKIVYKHGKYYLLIPIDISKKDTNKKIKKNGVIALDPGTRTFMTGYSTSEVIECSRKADIFKKLKNKISILQENRKYKTIQKYYIRIGNLVDDLHWRTIKYLTDNYDEILLPSFESQELVKKNKNKKVREQLLNLKHYQFKRRLICKSNMLGNVKVYIVGEEYTSKTCGRCGALNNNLGSKEIFKCVKDDCNFKTGRDVNGARNILLKHLDVCPRSTQVGSTQDKFASKS
ncbi:MAG: hypothetical protein COA94_03095 [Rickettsiales bacterium]|nr:MAG: hypothetical protein COA94_03095 [Rickettsiales bacterium]